MQDIFQRYEKKYLITTEQGRMLNEIMLRHMKPDRYGMYLVQNLYYDTENWEIIRRSIEKPCYKEKMRLRCYGVPDQKANFFLELKKKYEGVVYKRRIVLPGRWEAGRNMQGIVKKESSQIAKEIAFYFQTNAVSEKIYISYQRTALAGIEEQDLRITFDTDIRFRLNHLNFMYPGAGQEVLPQGHMLMEVKTCNGIPMWLVQALSALAIYPSSFSKFGACYAGFMGKKRDEYFQNPERMVKISA